MSACFLVCSSLYSKRCRGSCLKGMEGLEGQGAVNGCRWRTWRGCPSSGSRCMWAWTTGRTAATREGLEQGYCVAPSAQRFLLLFTFLKKNASKKVPLLHHTAYTGSMQHTPLLCACLHAALIVARADLDVPLLQHTAHIRPMQHTRRFLCTS